MTLDERTFIKDHISGERYQGHWSSGFVKYSAKCEGQQSRLSFINNILQLHFTAISWLWKDVDLTIVCFRQYPLTETKLRFVLTFFSKLKITYVLLN